MLEGALDREGDVVHLERLGDEVVGAGADRGDRRLHAAERRHDDDRQILATLDDLLAEVDSAHAVHVDVGQDEVEVPLGQPVESVLRNRGRGDLEAAPPQLGVEHVTHTSVVVDDQNATFHDGSFSPRVACLKRCGCRPRAGWAVTTP